MVARVKKFITATKLAVIKKRKRESNPAVSKQKIQESRHRRGKVVKDGFGNPAGYYCSCGKIHPVEKNRKINTTKTMAVMVVMK